MAPLSNGVNAKRKATEPSQVNEILKSLDDNLNDFSHSHSRCLLKKDSMQWGLIVKQNRNKFQEQIIY